MKKIVSITIQKPTGDQTLEVGAFLMGPDEKKSDVSVERITTYFSVVRVYFSDGRMFVFKGFPFITIKQ